MDGDLINVWGETDGSNTSGPTEIAIPKGFKAKIWALEIAGEACDVSIEISKDAGDTWKKVKTFKLASTGELTIEKKSRPLVVISETPYVAGTTGTLLKFTWSQATAAKTYLNALIEIVKDE